MKNKYYFESVLYSKESSNIINNLNENHKLRNKLSVEKAKKKAKVLSEKKETPFVAGVINKIGDNSNNYLHSYRIVPVYSAIIVKDSQKRKKIKEYLNSESHSVKINEDYISGDLKVILLD